MMKKMYNRRILIVVTCKNDDENDLNRKAYHYEHDMQQRDSICEEALRLLNGVNVNMNPAKESGFDIL